MSRFAVRPDLPRMPGNAVNARRLRRLRPLLPPRHLPMSEAPSRDRARAARFTSAPKNEIHLRDQTDLRRPAPVAKIFRFPFHANQQHIRTVSFPWEGRLAIVTDVR